MYEACGCVGSENHVHIAGAKLPARVFRDVEVLRAMLHDNDRQAGRNRTHCNAAGVFVVNLMSSPDAGKTSLLETTIRALHGRLDVAVIEGDLQTEMMHGAFVRLLCERCRSPPATPAISTRR